MIQQTKYHKHTCYILSLKNHVIKSIYAGVCHKEKKNQRPKKP